MSGEGYFARADYDFATGQEGDMAFRANDILYVSTTVDSNWLSGCSLDGLSSGIFPSNFVSPPLVLPERAKLSPGQEILVCTCPFPSEQYGDLKLDTGQLVLGRCKLDPNWWEGALLDPKGRATAQKGIFPANHVVELRPPVSQVLCASQSSVPFTEPALAKGRVVSDLSAQLPEEIDLFRGEVMLITEFVDSMWCRGSSQRGSRRGLFPRKFVKILEQEKTPPPQQQEAPKKSEPVFKPVKPVSSSPPRYPPPPLPDSILDLSSEETAPYGRSKYAFKAEFGNELGFPAGEIVKLLRHVDDEWTEGEFKGKIGIFPTSYVDIVVDCTAVTPPPQILSLMDSGYASTSSETSGGAASSPSQQDSAQFTDCRTVLFDFEATEPTDLPIRAGQKIFICREVNADWLEACLTSNVNRKGLVPKSFVESQASPGRKSSSPALAAAGNLAPNSTYRGQMENSTGYLHNNAGRGQDSGNSSPVRFREGGRKQNWQKQMNRQSLDETISKNLAGLDLGSPSRQATGTDRSTILGQNYLSQSAIGDIKAKGAWSYPNNATSSPPTSQREVSQRPSTDSDIFMTPPSTPQGGSQRNSFNSPPPASTPPPRPQNSPAIRNKSPIDPEKVERERREKEEERRKQMKEQREKVAAELVKSERAFVRDLEISLRCLSEGKGRIDSDVLLSGFKEVNALSNRVLARLDMEIGKEFSMQDFGGIFLDLEQDFRIVLDHFCEANDEAMILLERYEQDSGAQATLKICLQRMKQDGSNCMDMSSVLSRPLHRMMKYPLFLSELLKCTEDGHLDKRKLMEAVRIMTEVAQCINETKRRKDLVHKYRKDSDVTFSERLSKLNLHSVRKKGSRFSVRMTRTIGLTNLVVDEQFQQTEREFREVEKVVRHILKDLQSYCEQLQHAMVNEYSLAESWKDVWAKGGNSNIPESVKSDVRAYQDAWKKIGELLLPELFRKIKERARHPLNELNFMFHGPDKLIEKRGDKLLDYEAVAGNRGATTEHERTAKAEYEALNQQLLTEIPKLTSQSWDVVRMCVRALLGTQRTFGNELRNCLKSLDHHNRSIETIWPTFETRHQRAVQDLAALSCLGKAPPLTENKLSVSGPAGVTPPGPAPSPSPTASHRLSMRGSQRFKSYMKTPTRGGKISFPQQPQTEADRNSLRARWGAGGQLARVYVAAVPHAGVNAELDLNVNKGDLLLALIQKDPMGNTDRWYMDNGTSKGFVPRAVLVPLAENNSTTPRRPPLTKELITPYVPPSAETQPNLLVKRQASAGALIDLSDKKANGNVNRESHMVDLMGLNVAAPAARPIVPRFGGEAAPLPRQQHMAPKVPSVPKRPTYDNVGYDINSEAKSTPAAENAVSVLPRAAKNKAESTKKTDKGPLAARNQSRQELVPIRSAPPPPPPSGKKMGVISGGEWVGAAPEKEQEEIEEEEVVEFYQSEFDFTASDPNELSVGSGQIVAVHMKEDLQGNREWWLVEDELGGVGYAPANYFQPYQQA